MDPGLKNYLAYAFGRSNRMDFLRILNDPPPEQVLKGIYPGAHNVWETAVWMQVADRKLVRRPNGQHRLVPAQEVQADDKVLPNILRPCRLDVRDDGRFSFQWTDKSSTTSMYDRGDPQENERALREALPALYAGFRCGRRIPVP
jgi:hypothetical protein